MSQVVLYADEEYFRGAGKFLRVCRRLQLFFLITHAGEFRQDAKKQQITLNVFRFRLVWCRLSRRDSIVQNLFVFSSIDKVRHGIG